MTILLLVIFAFFIFTMFRRNRKQQAQQTEMRSKFVPGVEVMTSFGLYGRILEVDEAENKVVLELSPGTTATVHRQAVSKIVEPTEPVVEGDAATAADPTEAETTHGPESSHGAAAASPESQLHETPEQTLKRLEGEGK
ncbi:preprotein translocase subunit YajC [Sinomonas sp. P47F7]|uniref:preprotein translocase subunit YajC n=1 Tax=Sinomonas sp. P47F7 TaxID=3410987 RepID=UPI003BF54A31